MSIPVAVTKSRTVVIGGTKPLLIWIAPWFLIPWAMAALALFVIVLTKLGQDTVTVAGMAVNSAGQRYLVLTVLLAWTMLVLAGSLGLYRERWWARPLLGFVPIALGIASWIALLVLWPNITSPVAIRAILPSLAISLIVVWYFYGYSPVRKYYRSTRGQ